MSVKQGFKKTELGEIPETWKIMKSSEVCFRVTDGTHDTPKPSNTGYLLITSKNLKENGIDFSDSYLISADDFVEVNKRSKVDYGDVLFGMIGTIGNPNLVLKEHPQFAIKNVGLFKTAGDSKLGKWLSYYLSSQMIQKYLSKRLKGTSQKFVPLGLLRKLPILMPREDERNEIISILSTVDEAIHKTDRVIGKVETLKRGLMQRLLTRGIGHTAFKQTELGKIPEKWKIERLGNIVTELKSGFASGKRDDNGIIQLRMNNISTDGRVVLESYLKVPRHKNLSDYLLRDGDILFNNTNSVDLIGKTAIFREEIIPCTYSNHLTRLRVNPVEVVPEYVLYHIIRRWEHRYFYSICNRHVGQAGIRSSDIRRIKLPIAPLDEQRKITEILLTIDEKICYERAKKEKLENLKKGLMQVLLTGKVRVKVD